MSTPTRYSVKDYATADEYLGAKVNRPFGNATRIMRLVHPSTKDRTALARKGIGISHHGTILVIWRADGLTEFQPYNSVTSKKRINHYAPINLWSNRGTMYVGRWDDETAPKTAPKVMRCRPCLGSGLDTERIYRDRDGSEINYRGGWGASRKIARYVTRFEDHCEGCETVCEPSTCLAGWVTTINGSQEHHGKGYGMRADGTYGEHPNPTGTKPGHHRHGLGTYSTRVCSACNGTKTQDYGSRVIHYQVQPQTWYLVSHDHRIVGHIGAERYTGWVECKPKPKPIKTRTIIGEVTAYRGWGIDTDGTLTALGVEGVRYDSFNLPNPTCRKNEPHTAPAIGCSCGYWAVPNQRDVPVYTINLWQAFGIVNLWGKVIRHDLGYRCRSMTVQSLFVADETVARTVAARYPDVPVYVSSWPLSMPVDELIPVSINNNPTQGG